MTSEIEVGAFVVTSDGHEIGRVKRIESSAFLVDAPLAFDYWLETNLAKNASAERVDLTIPHADLASYKMDRPHDHNEFQSKPPDSLNPSSVRDGFLNR